MYLKTLSIKGFKSFADHAVLDLQDGITVVVGPNGSGKSNVVDAIAWVLGAQAPSAVRSQKMEDVIFAGTQAKSALGRAEVSLTIDNSDGVLPIEFSEVTITRTLFRSGDSDYQINGVSCRLLDIQDLLSDSGVGRQQHIIVSQGQIDAVLNARPEERRAIIEEAAGVLKYRKRKERAERRLSATEENLNRLGDLVREVKRQLKPLEKQADAARRHADVLSEATTLRTYLAGRELTALTGEMEASKRRRSEADRREGELKGILANLDALVLDAEAELAAIGGSDVADVLSRTRSLSERVTGQTNVVAERQRRLEGELQSAVDDGVVASLEAESARIVADMTAAEEERQHLAPEFEQVALADQQLQLDREEFERQWGDGVSAAPPEAAEARAQLNALRSAAARDGSEDSRLNDQLEAVAVRHDRLVTERSDAEAALLRLREQIPELEQSIVSSTSGVEAAVREAEAAAEEQRKVEADASHWKARAEALEQALSAARDKAGASALDGTPGVLGTVLDLVAITPGFEMAVEAAASAALGSVVVESVDAAREALAELLAKDLTGSVIPLQSGGGSLPPVAIPPGTQPLRAKVFADRKDVSTLLDQIFKRTVVTEQPWSTAADLSTANPELTVLTTSGAVFGPMGWRIGGDQIGATGAALEEAQAQADSAAPKIQQAAAAKAGAEEAKRQARLAQTDLEAFLRDAMVSLETAETTVTRTTSELEDLEASRKQLTRQRYEITQRAEADRKKLASLQLALPGLEADEQKHLDRAQTVGEARSALEERGLAASTLRTELEVRAAGVAERIELLESRRQEVESRLERLEAERGEARARREEIEGSLGQVGELAQRLISKRLELDDWLIVLEAESAEQSAAAREVSTSLSAKRRERSDAENELAQIRERRQKFDLSDAENRVRLETLTETVRRDLDLEPETAMAAERPEVPDGASPESRLRDLDRELKIMGPINPLALEEFEELKERHEFLSGQLDDVKSARKELMRLIRQIDDEIVNVFRAAYADVAENFTRLFQVLFPGGKGTLTLTNPDDLLNCGLEIEAKPSGKNVKKLSLLSGGERSLTALGFLFAVFRSRPSPFYVMDEVEAALDDFNLNRFLSLVQEFRSEAQLIIVSHQKRTMEAADVLYGVSMKAGGSSKVVSEKVIDRNARIDLTQEAVIDLTEAEQVSS